MDVRYINPFIHGALEVLRKMAFIEPIPGKPFVKQDENAHGEVSGIIGITGDAIGSLSISFTESCICTIAGNMLGGVYHEATRDVYDAVGEITNMVSGAARTCLEKEGLSVFAGIPTVIFGHDHTITHVLKAPSIVIPFSTAKGTFVIEICIRETTEEERHTVKYGVQNVKMVSAPAQAAPAPPQPMPSPSAPVAPPPPAPKAPPEPPPSTPEEKLVYLKKKLQEIIAARDNMRQQLTDKPFMGPAKRQLYKKNVPIFDARIKRIKLDITALEMITKISQDQSDNPKISSHYQHYQKK